MDNTPPVKKSSRVLERIRKEKAANASKQDIGSTNTNNSTKDGEGTAGISERRRAMQERRQKM